MHTLPNVFIAHPWREKHLGFVDPRSVCDSPRMSSR